MLPMPLSVFLVRGDMLMLKEYQDNALFVKFGLINLSFDAGRWP